jgi:tetratricopeptide (TPR) repeat protein
MVLRALGIGPAASLFAAGSLKERDRLLMTDFSVSGADSSLGRVVSDAVRAGLVQSEVLTLMSPSEIAGALQRMERPGTSRLDLALARSLSVREGVKAIVDGDVTMVGASYIIAIKLVTADSGKDLTSFRATAAGPADIITVADELSRKLRAKAGESLRTVNGAPPLAQVTTASLEALRKYSEGSRAADVELDRPKAIRLLREAVAIDTLFAEAWRKLGVSMSNVGMPPSETGPVLTKAFLLRDRLAEGDRERVTATYYWSGPGRDRAQAIEAYERLLARGDSNAALNNMALALSSRREFARSESLYRANIRRNPVALVFANLMGVLASQGKWTEVESVLAVARARFPGNTSFLEVELQGQLLRGNLEAYRRSVDSALRVADPRNPSGAVFRAAGLAGLEGRLGEWRSLVSRGWRIDSTVGVNTPAIALTGFALNQRIQARLPFDNELKAYEEQLKKTPLSSLPASDVPYLQIAALFAQAGRADRARASMAEYERAVTDTTLRRDQQPDLRAALGEIASAEGRWEEAVREMRKADSLPDGPVNSCAHCLSLNLLRIFAQAGMADSALAQYEAYLRTPRGARPRSGPDSDVPATTMEAVARMYEQRGDTNRAVQAYRDFVEMWKRADPELQPRVVAARRRIEALTPVERPRR